MFTTYEMVKYTPELKPQVLDLLYYLLGPDVTVNAAYFTWKYECNPYTEAPYIYLAVQHGQVVGMRGFSGAKWQAGSPCHTWTSLCAGDFVIAPAHRNRQMVTQIMRAALQDLASAGHMYVFNWSANQITYLSSLAAGWRGPGSFRTLHTRDRQRGRAILCIASTSVGHNTGMKLPSTCHSPTVHTPRLWLNWLRGLAAMMSASGTSKSSATWPGVSSTRCRSTVTCFGPIQG